MRRPRTIKFISFFVVLTSLSTLVLYSNSNKVGVDHEKLQRLNFSADLNLKNLKKVESPLLIELVEDKERSDSSKGVYVISAQVKLNRDFESLDFVWEAEGDVTLLENSQGSISSVGKEFLIPMTVRSKGGGLLTLTLRNSDLVGSSSNIKIAGNGQEAQMALFSTSGENIQPGVPRIPSLKEIESSGFQIPTDATLHQ